MLATRPCSLFARASNVNILPKRTRWRSVGLHEVVNGAGEGAASDVGVGEILPFGGEVEAGDDAMVVMLNILGEHMDSTIEIKERRGQWHRSHICMIAQESL